MRYEAQRARSRLLLADGRSFEGYGFGARVPVAGEVVFNTGMVGYPEALTDPSYAGQVLTLTYPLIGNYGIPSAGRDEMGIPLHFESDRVQVTALVTGDLSERYSHHGAVSSLDQWLTEHGVPCITGIDTRALTKHIRRHGVMPAKVVPAGVERELDFVDPNATDLVGQVTRREISVFGEGGVNIVAVDFGIKNNIIREFVRRGVRLTVVPAGHDFSTIEYDGRTLTQPSLMISVMNGRRLGGGFWMAPDSKPDDGLFDLCIAREMSRLRMFGIIRHFLRGSQATQEPITTGQAARISITAVDGSLPAHADGEILCIDGKQLEIELLPRPIELICPPTPDGSDEG